MSMEELILIKYNEKLKHYEAEQIDDDFKLELYDEAVREIAASQFTYNSQIGKVKRAG